ncbi:MAG: UvrD-helicase domain-containing protein [Proteobacteria bacterium]|nr:UvrD-helicase domain-containing protein [Pseudomonadota bacterium]MBU1386266.1 UvrD-helicase domain-containing protein [Pseudomonadota bacterium]MBU1542959.1 UvrD-helicase domain-containing protein [Pseudomonadota bacterium]MBU2431310.1 UvrD-helicase domain-containing protein [Pseudomonadota bacterium]MBU2479981.1 UvrD-helicase domain-containing protein [Pseudomonadota bacterium]
MKFAADLHLHSKYSRATAKNLDLENLYRAAQIKGVFLVGTGDFTYPAWIKEIEEKLEPAEQGLFALKKEFARKIDQTVPESCKNPVRFILQSEISNIYKKDGRVRKNHNLIYFSQIETVKKFNARLDAIGNIRSDGRPILGLDAADLLALMLEIDDTGMFIPAHIWTPWFSLFGSKSGFDSLEACFGELTKHIFAVETGLSSDPPMNWRVADLDHVSLISNSDAHSPGYLGRNATVFNTDPGFENIRTALKTRNPETYLGTLDMYPDQGKYHYDGHRNCGISLNPSQTLEIKGLCPECGKPLTCGVLYRVQELACRPQGFVPDHRQGFSHLVPLSDILSEIFSVGPHTKKVTAHYQKAIELLGPELSILLDLELAKIESAGIPMLPEAIDKMRNGDIRIDPGFDGEFGKVGIFSNSERDTLKGEKYFLFTDVLPKSGEKKSQAKKQTRPAALPQKTADSTKKPTEKPPADTDLLSGLNPEQRKAVMSQSLRTMIQAGPGTGKTRTLTAKIAWLITRKQVPPEKILALTFTNKAARQLEERIAACMAPSTGRVFAATFHSFCLSLLKTYSTPKILIAGEMERRWLLQNALKDEKKKTRLSRIDTWISLCKQQLCSCDDDPAPVIGPENAIAFKPVYKNYEKLCREHGLVDFEDLIFKTVALLDSDAHVLKAVQKAYPHVFIDEYQDLNFAQYSLVKKLCPEAHITVIGDPDQSIYGFRGSDNIYFKQFAQDFPGCESIELTRNYRSTQMILDASFQMITQQNSNTEKTRIIARDNTRRQLIIKECATDRSEAVSIARMIERMVGGTSFFSMDAGRVTEEGIDYAFSDFAVLCRTRRQCRIFQEAFEKEGIPCRSADRQKLFEPKGIQQLIFLCRMLAENTFSKKINSPLDQAMCKDIFGSVQKAATAIKAAGHDPLLPGPDHENTMICAVARICQAAGLEDIMTSDEKHRIAYEKILSIAGQHQDLGSMMNALHLDQDADVIGLNTQDVSLMTIHAAKGLEFAVVFIAGCEQGLIPYLPHAGGPVDIEEERRLFYVAMTRAMDILCLTYAKKRTLFGTTEERHRSIFIDDIETNLTKLEKTVFQPKPRNREQQLELFPDA